MNNYVLTVDGEKIKAEIKNSFIKLNNRIFEDSEIIEINPNLIVLRTGNKIIDAVVEKKEPDSFRVTIDGLSYEITIRSELEQSAFQLMKNKEKLSQSGKIYSPMPGLILKIKKKVGDEIKTGDSLLVLEAMKMENDLRAESSGVIKAVHIEEGSSVEKNQLLICIE